MSRVTKPLSAKARIDAGPETPAAMPVSKEGENVLDLTNEAPANERFKAISLNAMDEWAEKFPRLKEKLADIKMSSLIFPFKASPYLVEELIDWEMEGDIADDPFYRLVFPTMAMLSDEHQAKLRAASDEGDPFKLKDAVDEIREDLNPHPAGQKQLNAPKKEDLTLQPYPYPYP